MNRNNQEQIAQEYAEFKKSGSKLMDTFKASEPIKNNIDISLVIQKIRAIEEQNNQSVSFVLHEDGSGAFEDFWSEQPIVEFHNLEELMSVLITRS